MLNVRYPSESPAIGLDAGHGWIEVAGHDIPGPSLRARTVCIGPLQWRSTRRLAARVGLILAPDA